MATPALRRFLYLDTVALNEYVDALEDGRRERTKDTDTHGRRLGGRAGTSALGIEAAREGTSETRSERLDTHAARFQRLVELGQQEAGDEGLWAELQDLSQLADAGYGTVIHVECEAYVPDVVKMFGSGELGSLLDMVAELAPQADALGLDLEGMPTEAQTSAMKQFTSRMSSDLILVGEGEDEEGWRIAGRLDSRYVRDANIDGFVRIVGKVAERWPANQWKPMLALPGASLIPRKERRALERKKPKDSELDNYLRGPAVMLDLLAIYR